jgi:hypothetical protein
MKAESSMQTSDDYEDWVNRKWRPFTAWTYLVICLFDFLVAPIMTFYFFGHYGNDTSSYSQWQPITLVGSGLFHVAMGAIIGVTAWQRGEEKKTRYRYEHDYENEGGYNDRASHRDRLTRDEYEENR